MIKEAKFINKSVSNQQKKNRKKRKSFTISINSDRCSAFHVVKLVSFHFVAVLVCNWYKYSFKCHLLIILLIFARERSLFLSLSYSICRSGDQNAKSTGISQTNLKSYSIKPLCVCEVCVSE